MTRDDQQVQDAGTQHDLSSLMGLQNGIRDERSGDGSSTKPAPVQALHSRLCRVNGVELDVNLSLYSALLVSSALQALGYWPGIPVRLWWIRPCHTSPRTRLSRPLRDLCPSRVHFLCRCSGQMPIITNICVYSLLRIEHVLEKNRLRLHCRRNIGFVAGMSHKLGSKSQRFDAYTGAGRTGGWSVLASFCISACRDAAFKLPPRLIINKQTSG